MTPKAPQKGTVVDLGHHGEEEGVEAEVVDAVVVEEAALITKRMGTMVGPLVKTRVVYNAIIVKIMDIMLLSVRIQEKKEIKKIT